MDKDYSFTLEGTNGKGALLVHGLTGAPAEMKFIGKQLNKQGFTVHAPVLAGHCRTMAALEATRYEDWLESLHEALLRFAPQVNEVHMAGICVGGGLAMALAQAEPERVRSVVVYSPALDYDGWNAPFYQKLSTYGLPVLVRLPGLKHIGFTETEPYGMKCERTRAAIIGDGSGIEGTLPKFPALGLHQNARLNKALKRALPVMKTPTLLIHAREDDVAHPRNAEKIKALHGGECELVMLENSYHMIHVDQERRKVAELTGDFFLRHGLADQAKAYA